MGRRSFRQFRTLLVVPHPGTTRPDSLSVRIVFRLNQLPPAPQSGNCFGDISDELSAMLGEYTEHTGMLRTKPPEEIIIACTDGTEYGRRFGYVSMRLRTNNKPVSDRIDCNPVRYQEKYHGKPPKSFVHGKCN